ncbi:hypothetical protein ASE74_15895 [Pedobacter sp. Leaf216]|uniref:response regulator n=1 Tax=Pedobacter sp. Leaf216 TaxID=1735684 RepID=UPI0006F57B1D|nr:response regulator [Pedobacter sp. Leaf216]KQM77881.1 hypothetical protein ASE74_15895 [Pedobacter sp. Leaf216]
MAKILVLDDDQSNAEVIQLALEDQAFIVTSICHSDQLEKTITDFQPDLLVMDILLDKGDGRELCNIIKKNTGTGHIRILLITAMLESQALKVPSLADDIIFKPFDYKNLHQKVCRLIS